jgi:hypothetical protein
VHVRTRVNLELWGVRWTDGEEEEEDVELMVFCSCHGAPKLCRWTRIRREVTAPLMIIGETRRNPRWILLATTTLQSMDEALLPSVPALHLHCMHMRSLSRLYGWGVLLPRGGRGDYGSGVRINKRLLLELPCRSAASRRRWRTPLGPAFLLFASLDRSELGSAVTACMVSWRGLGEEGEGRLFMHAAV